MFSNVLRGVKTFRTSSDVWRRVLLEKTMEKRSYVRKYIVLTGSYMGPIKQSVGPILSTIWYQTLTGSKVPEDSSDFDDSVCVLIVMT